MRRSTNRRCAVGRKRLARVLGCVSSRAAARITFDFSPTIGQAPHGPHSSPSASVLHGQTGRASRTSWMRVPALSLHPACAYRPAFCGAAVAPPERSHCCKDHGPPVRPVRRWTRFRKHRAAASAKRCPSRYYRIRRYRSEPARQSLAPFSRWSCLSAHVRQNASASQKSDANMITPLGLSDGERRHISVR